MRIKEVEQRTGLTAKAIRLYESKGLLKPARETENDYRDYTEEDVARLKTIAILRKLDVPVAVIKEWTDGKTEQRDILRKAADQNREAAGKMSCGTSWLPVWRSFWRRTRRPIWGKRSGSFGCWTKFWTS